MTAHREQWTFAAKAARAAALGASALWLLDREEPGEAPLDSEQRTRTTGSAQLPVLFFERATAAPWFADAGGLREVQRALDQGRKVEVRLPLRAEWNVAMTRPAPLATANVLGVLPGRGEHSRELVVLGAHHDHIGNGVVGSLGGKEAVGHVHPGADDNASGVAGLLDLARRCQARGAQDRTMVFAAFGAEELGQLGSRWFLEHLDAAAPVVAMIDLNMIGRGRSRRLVIYGAGTGQGFGDCLKSAAAAAGLVVDVRDRTNFRSDQSVFVTSGVPSLWFTTGLHDQYHRPGDVPGLVECEAALRILDGIDQLVRDLAAGPRHAFVEAPR